MALTVTPRGFGATLFVLFVVAVCVRLGFWQLDRLEERRARNAELAAAVASESVVLDAAAAAAAFREPGALLHRRVELTGRYLHDAELVVRGRASGGRPGVHVVTPLELEGAGYAVLVNRGWLASPDARTVDLGAHREPGVRRLLGLTQPLPDEADGAIPVTGDDGVTSVQRVVLDDVRARTPIPVLPLVVVQLPDGTPASASVPARVEPPPPSEGNHLAYAVQWFGFAAIALVGWAVVVFRPGARAPARRA